MKAADRFEDDKGTLRERGTIALLPTLALAALTALAAYLCWRLLAPFVNAFAWAFALAVACAPLRKWLFARMPRLLATILMLALVIIVIGVPLTFVLHQLFQESIRAQSFLRESLHGNDWRNVLAGNRWLGPIWNWAYQQLELRQVMQQVAGAIAASIAPAVARSVSVLAQTGVMLLALFFFLRDGETLIAALGRLLPLSPVERGELFGRVLLMLRAALYGRVLIGFVQGFLAGVMFAIVGLPAALFWGSIMSILSVLPFLGAFIVWVPAAIYLALTGHWISGLVLTAWGVLVVHTADNVLYPVLVGARVGIHSLLLFVAFVGGVIAFGPTGLILGPCIIAFSAGLVEVWRERRNAAPMEGGG